MTKDPVKPSIPTENLNLPPMNPRLVEEFISRMKSTAVKSCDTEDCLQPAEWWVIYSKLCACNEHRGYMPARKI